MAGTALKTFGIVLIVLGSLAFVVGAGAAATGYVMEEENRDRTFPDPEESDRNSVLVVGGLVAAGAGVPVLLVGLLLAAWGGARGRAELLGREVTMTAPLVVGGVLLVAGLGAAAWYFDVDAGAMVASVGGGAADEPASPLAVDTDEGTIRGASAPVVGSVNEPGSDTVVAFDVHPDAGSLLVEAAWDTSESLLMLLEERDGDAWREVARTSGGSPLAIGHDVTGGGEFEVRLFLAEPGATPGVDYRFAASSFAGEAPAGYSALVP